MSVSNTLWCKAILLCYDIQKQIQEEKTTQLQEQIVFLQSLCEKITEVIELPAQAFAGLGDSLFRARGIVEK